MKKAVFISSLMMALVMVSCGNKSGDDLMSSKDENKTVLTERFEGTVPAADGPGIFYQVVLMRYQDKDSGIFHTRQTYIDGTDRGDVSFDTYGRFIISRKNGERVLRLTPFEDYDEVVNFSMDSGSSITMLDMQMNRIQSNHNYTLKKIK